MRRLIAVLAMPVLLATSSFASRAAAVEAQACPWAGAHVVDGIWCHYENRGSYGYVDGVWWHYGGSTYNSAGELVFLLDSENGAWRTVKPSQPAPVRAW